MLRTLEQLLDAARITDPRATYGDIMYDRLRDLISCPKCGTLGLLDKRGGSAPTHSIAAYQAALHDNGGLHDPALKLANLHQCDCRMLAAELVNALTQKSVGTIIAGSRT